MKTLALLILTTLAQAEEIQSNGLNFVTKSYGGRSYLVLPGGQKLVTMTWKKDSMWILTRTARPGEFVGDEYQFQEKSTWGLIEGTVYVKEAQTEAEANKERKAKKTQPVEKP